MAHLCRLLRRGCMRRYLQQPGVFQKAAAARNKACETKGTSKEGNEVGSFFFPTAIHSFLISSEMAERDELGRAADPPPRAVLANAALPSLMELRESPLLPFNGDGAQTNEQPSPGSALRVFINRDAEALMALIFQATRRLVRAPARGGGGGGGGGGSIRDAAQRQTG